MSKKDIDFSNNESKIIFEKLNKYVFLVNDNCEIIYCNKYAINELQIKIKNITNENIYDILNFELLDKDLNKKLSFKNIPKFFNEVNKVKIKDKNYKFIKWETVNLDNKNVYLIGEDVTEIYQEIFYLKKIKSDNQNFKVLFENSKVGIVLSDSKGTFIKVNKAFCNIVGYSENELKSMNFRDISIEEFLLSELNLLNELISNKIQSYTLEKQYLKKNNNVIWVNVTISAVRDDDNKPEYFIGIVEEITQKKIAEEKLMKSQEMLEFSQRIAKLGSYETDLINDYWIGSDEFYNIFGFKEKRKYSQKEFQKIVHPDDLDFVLKEFERCIINKESFDLDYRCINQQTGKIIFVSSKSKIIYDEYNKPVKVIGIKQDITERKNFENKIFNQNSLIKSIFASIPNPFYVTDSKTHEILFANPATYEDENLKSGITCHEYLHNNKKPCYYSGHNCPIKEMKKTKQPVVQQHTHVKSSGEKIIVEVNCYPILTKEGELDKIIHNVFDITEKKEIEIEKEKYINKLEETNRLKEDFLTVITHELKTPISGIMGFSDLLLDSYDLEDEVYDNVNYINQSANRLIKIVNNLLELSAFQVYKDIEILNVSFDIEYLINGIITILDEDFMKKSNQVKFKISGNKIIVSDPNRLEQILFNLLDNANKFTDNGKIEINFSSDKNSYIFEIKDTGIGIKKNDFENIFRLFQQADTSINRNYQGAGLGLSICKTIIEAMNGTINVESEYGKGSTFTFTLPINIKSD